MNSYKQMFLHPAGRCSNPEQFIVLLLMTRATLQSNQEDRAAAAATAPPGMRDSAKQLACVDRGEQQSATGLPTLR